MYDVRLFQRGSRGEIRDWFEAIRVYPSHPRFKPHKQVTQTPNRRMNAPLTVNIHTGDNANHVSSNISISVMLQNVTLLYKVVKKIGFLRLNFT